MKTKLILVVLVAMIASSLSLAQTVPFTFVKACTGYDRTAFTAEMTKRKFYVVEESSKKSKSKLMEGATFYCNEKERELGNAEIDIFSVINGDKKIVEINFLKGAKHDYTKNYGEIFTQMNSILNKLPAIQSKKYKTEVNVFTKNGVYYYTYKVSDLPVIVVSSYKINDEYF